MNIEKSVNSFVDSIYDDYFNPQLNRFLPKHWLGEFVMEQYDLDKKQFKDLLMNTTEDDSQDVTKLVCDFNTNQKEISKCLKVIPTWLSDDFYDQVNNKQMGIIDDILNILKVEEVV